MNESKHPVPIDQALRTKKEGTNFLIVTVRFKVFLKTVVNLKSLMQANFGSEAPIPSSLYTTALHISPKLQR